MSDIANQYKTQNDEIIAPPTKTLSLENTQNWTTVSLPDGSTFRLPNEQLIKMLLAQNQKQSSEISQLRQTQREIQGQIQRLTQQLRLLQNNRYEDRL